MIFRYTRFEKIYSSREEAIIKLNNTSRYFAENVAVRYKNGKSEDSYDTILALFQSNAKGDYIINFDSGLGEYIGSDGSNVGRIFDMTRKNGESDEEVLNRAVFDVVSLPKEWDLVIIHSENNSDITYLYHNSVWICLTQDLVLTPHDSRTVKLTVVKNEAADAYDITAEVPIDNSSLCIDPTTQKLRVGMIDCGRLSNLRS